ncbi:hypothetical protein [Orenia marismortui]|uniref:Uncharacterized protein n=1 Tax=Orenia marismortui TaxID=46469 RepID=A0A4R8GSH4_9FIRM|nr:hypothetical protein [Orenia marismortui]TDX48849.1 hypothetical protein C7959_12528 [Orenia marismortui]
MTISVADIRTVRYFPEILPATEIRNISPSSEASPIPLDLRRFGKDRLLKLRDLYLDRDSDIRYTVTGDDFSLERRASAVDNKTMDFSISATDNLTYRLYNTDTGATKADFRTYFSVLVDKLTVADKLKYGINLSSEEERINEELGVRDKLEMGNIPLPYDYKFEREYSIIDSYTVSSRISSVPTTGNGAVFEDFTVRSNEALILTSVGATPFTIADNFRIIIDRDDDNGYITLLPSVINDLNKEIKMWIPATRELRLRAIANNPLSNADIRVNLLRIRLNDILKVRWNLVDRSEFSQEFVNQVLGGVF